jgi:hypothetical protein
MLNIVQSMQLFYGRNIPAIDLALLVAGGISVSMTTGVAVYLLRLDKDQLTRHMGPTSWDFTKSWASNLTIIGSLVSTLLVAGALPEKTHHLSKQQFGRLNAVCALIVTVAPLFYNFYRDPVQLGTGAELQYEGFVWTFLLASFATLSGIYGQLMVLYFIIDELESSKLLSVLTSYMFIVLLFVVATFVGIYAVRTMSWTAISQTLPEHKDKIFKPGSGTATQWSLL